MFFMKLNKKIRDLIKMIKQLRFYSDISKKSDLNTDTIATLQTNINLPNGIKRIRIKALPGTQVLLSQILNDNSLNNIQIIIDHSGIYNLDDDFNLSSLKVNLNIEKEAQLFLDVLEKLDKGLSFKDVLQATQEELLRKPFELTNNDIASIQEYKQALSKIINDFYCIIDMYF